MDLELRQLLRRLETANDPLAYQKIARLMLRQGLLDRWEEVLSRLKVVNESEGSGLHEADDFGPRQWNLSASPAFLFPVDYPPGPTLDRARLLFNLGKKIVTPFQIRKTMAYLISNFDQFQEYLESMEILKVVPGRKRIRIQCEVQHCSAPTHDEGHRHLENSLMPRDITWGTNFISRDSQGYYLIRTSAKNSIPKGVNLAWEEFCVYLNCDFVFSIRFLPYKKLIPKILNSKSNLNKILNKILTDESNRPEQKNPDPSDGDLEKTASSMAWTLNDELWETASENRKKAWRKMASETVKALMLPAKLKKQMLDKIQRQIQLLQETDRRSLR